MILYIKKFFYDLFWVIINKFITHIPFWSIRKICFKIAGLKIGKNSRIGIGTILINPWNISIGYRSVVNENCYIDGRGELKIGDDVSISIYSKILTATHDVNSDSFEYVKKSVNIGDKCWIGLNACILPGSSLEEGTVIGAMSVFKGESESFGIYIGNPSKYIKQREISEKFRQKDIRFFK